MKLEFKGKRVVLVRDQFTQDWAKRNGAKVSSTKDTLTIEADKKVIDLIAKQKKAFCIREGLVMSFPKATK